jgi:hypothetical protein
MLSVNYTKLAPIVPLNSKILHVLIQAPVFNEFYTVLLDALAPLNAHILHMQSAQSRVVGCPTLYARLTLAVPTAVYEGRDKQMKWELLWIKLLENHSIDSSIIDDDGLHANGGIWNAWSETDHKRRASARARMSAGAQAAFASAAKTEPAKNQLPAENAPSVADASAALQAPKEATTREAAAKDQPRLRPGERLASLLNLEKPTWSFSKDAKLDAPTLEYTVLISTLEAACRIAATSLNVSLDSLISGSSAFLQTLLQRLKGKFDPATISTLMPSAASDQERAIVKALVDGVSKASAEIDKQMNMKPAAAPQKTRTPAHPPQSATAARKPAFTKWFLRRWINKQ